MLLTKRTSHLDTFCLNYEQLFHPVQRTACTICHCSSLDEIVSARATGVLSITSQFLYL